VHERAERRRVGRKDAQDAPRVLHRAGVAHRLAPLARESRRTVRGSRPARLSSKIAGLARADSSRRGPAEVR
jgi:hypothetical protein